MAVFHEEGQPLRLIPQDDILPIKYYRLSITKMRLVSEYLGLAVPFLVTVYYTWVKHQRYLLEQFRKHAAATGKLTFSVLSTGGALHIVKIEPLLKLVRKQEMVEEKECVECEVLHDPGPEERKADVIFIHGIKGSLHKTWTQARSSSHITKERLHRRHHNRRKPQRAKRKLEILEMEEARKEEEEWSKCWPKDWLPQDCPQARVIAINYTTDPYLWKPVWSSSTMPPRSTMRERSWEMMNKLLQLGVGRHAIIWVGHSKGGLYAKQILVNACETMDEKYRIIGEMTRGIQFYSVPHRGSPLANINLPIVFKQSVELTEVQKDCEEVLTLHKKFREYVDCEKLRPHIKSFIETRLTFMTPFYLRIVSLDSADADMGESYGVPVDHINICKPRNRSCFLYRELVDLIDFCEDIEMDITSHS